MKIQIIEINKIVADKNQPRKVFDVTKLGTLRSSIKEHGILTPLTVQDQGNDTYLLIDGERRYRMAKDLKLKEVPALVEPAMTESKRRLKQFHIQETHASWSPTEKAEAIQNLAESLGTTMKEIGPKLGIPLRTLQAYIAFMSLSDRKNFTKASVPLEFAMSIKSVISRINAVAKKENKSLSRGDRSDIENMIYARIVSGEIISREQINVLSDIIVAGGMKMLKSLTDTKKDISDLLESTKAEAITAARRLHATAGYMANLFTILEKGSPVPPSSDLINRIKNLKSLSTSYLNLFAD